MGRSLGYHDSDELDRPELNKCPDCECYFASDDCPLCGKVCPEAFRAGNRAKVKPPKKRSNSSGRVQFIPWYHTWLFILLMLYFMPIVGVILFFTSPHSRKSKIIAASVVVGIYVLLIALTVGSGLIGQFFEKPLVNDDLTRAEYVERCEEMDAEDFYRTAPDGERYVTLEVTVISRTTDWADSDAVYYTCRDRDGGTVQIYIRDCNLENRSNYLPGDTLRVWGESAGMVSFHTEYGAAAEMPCLYMAYCERIG